jgi:hypothetical protein
MIPISLFIQSAHFIVLFQSLCCVWLLCVASTYLHLHYVNLFVSNLPFLFRGFPFLCHSSTCFLFFRFHYFLIFSRVLFYYFNFFIFFFHLGVLLFLFAYLLMHYVSDLNCPINLTMFSTHFKFFVISLSYFLSPLKRLTLFVLFVSLFVHSYLFI